MILPGMDPNGLYWLVGGYVLLLVLSVLIPIVLDIWKAYGFANSTQRELLKDIIEKIPPGGIDSVRLGQLLGELTQSPPGIPGLGRSTMALTVILVLGAAIIHLLVIPSELPNREIIGNVLSLLGGALASIVGFYFGGKVALDTANQANLSPGATSSTPGTTPTSPAGPAGAVAGAARPLEILTDSSLRHARCGQPYASDPFTAVGGKLPYSWTIKSQPQPPGLSMDPQGGILHFNSAPTIQTGAGGFDVAVEARDAAQATVSEIFHIVVDA